MEGGGVGGMRGLGGGGEGDGGQASEERGVGWGVCRGIWDVMGEVEGGGWWDEEGGVGVMWRSRTAMKMRTGFMAWGLGEGGVVGRRGRRGRQREGEREREGREKELAYIHVCVYVCVCVRVCVCVCA